MIDKVIVIGLGYVGLPLALAAAKSGLLRQAAAAATILKTIT